MSSKTKSLIMLNVQNLYNSAMQKSSSSTSFNIQKALRWKEKGCCVFCIDHVHSKLSFKVVPYSGIVYIFFYSTICFHYCIPHTGKECSCKTAFSLEGLLFCIFNHTVIGVLQTEQQKTRSELSSRLLRFQCYEQPQLSILLKCLWTHADNTLFVQN